MKKKLLQFYRRRGKDAARTCIITSFGTCVCSCSWPVDEAGRGAAAAAERDAIYQGAETGEVGQGLV